MTRPIRSCRATTSEQMLTGTLARPNAVGIQIGNTVTSPTNSLIGGTTAATRNVISGNTGSGVVLPTGNGHACDRELHRDQR